MGLARATQEAKDIADNRVERENVGRKKRELESKLKSLDAQITALNSEVEVQKEELNKLVSEDELKSKALAKDRSDISRIRGADIST